MLDGMAGWWMGRQQRLNRGWQELFDRMYCKSVVANGDSTSALASYMGAKVKLSSHTALSVVLWEGSAALEAMAARSYPCCCTFSPDGIGSGRANVLLSLSTAVSRGWSGGRTVLGPCINRRLVKRRIWVFNFGDLRSGFANCYLA
jgi:hypothetical protein